MSKVRYIIHERFQGTSTPEEAFATVLLSEVSLTDEPNSRITEVTNLPQDSLGSPKGEDRNGTSEE